MSDQPSTPAEVMMPPETLQQRMEADGRIWKAGFEEGLKSSKVLLNEVALLCAHGAIICAPCNYIPESWRP